MMTQTHGITGIAVWMTGDALTRVCQLHHPYWITLAGALIAWEAAKAPDIDNPDSRPGRAANRLVPGMSTTIESLFGHRGLTHWASTGIAIGVTIGSLASLIHPTLWWIGLAIAIGWLTHLAGDACTYQGVPAYGPFSNRPIRLPYGKRIACGGKTETQFVYPLVRVWESLAFLSSAALAVFA